MVVCVKCLYFTAPRGNLDCSIVEFTGHIPLFFESYLNVTDKQLSLKLSQIKKNNLCSLIRNVAFLGHIPLLLENYYFIVSLSLVNDCILAIKNEGVRSRCETKIYPANLKMLHVNLTQTLPIGTFYPIYSQV